MKKIIAASLFVLSVSSVVATAQPIESEPLKPFVPYTLQGETDPMALDSSAASAPAPVAPPSGEFAPLAPADPVPTATMPAQQADIPAQAPTNAPIPASEFPPAPSATSSAPFYPNNAVSGLPPQDESKFENRIFCTLKVSFGSIAAGIDGRAADLVKAFLDERADKLSYVRSGFEGKEGEFSYCVTIDQHNHKAETYTALKALLVKADVSAPVSIAGKGFTPFTAGGKDYTR